MIFDDQAVFNDSDWSISLNDNLKISLEESQDKDTRQYYDASEQINEVLIHQHYLSQKDIEFCIEYDITKLSGESNYNEIERLHEVLKNEYAINNE